MQVHQKVSFLQHNILFIVCITYARHVIPPYPARLFQSENLDISKFGREQSGNPSWKQLDHTSHFSIFSLQMEMQVKAESAYHTEKCI